ncbi:MAG: recombinase family protein [Oscillospiraceae bacterium]|nr:recombinase family protein [Oscillospiraceae bacterium]
MVNILKAKTWKTAAYIRLSREDGDKSESESVINQRQIIADFIAAQPDLNGYAEFIDDGATGTNFNRQGFQSMLEEIKNGNINCVVVKDLSRFGRNYTEAGTYMEQIFPMFGVRFISVTDHIDSYTRPSEMDSILVPLKNLLNDSYSRDLSVKIRSAMTAKRKRGEFIGGYAAYGYLKNPKDKYKLIVDHETAQTVRDIYRWYIEGLSKSAIAKKLNIMGIPSPAKQRFIRDRRDGRPRHEYSREVSGFWTLQSVNGVLENPVYIGNMTQGKRTQASYKNRKRLKIPKEDWIIAENTHEPIVDKATFDKVQELLKLRTKSTLKAGTVHLFSGLLKCADCNRAMERVVVRKKNGKTYTNYRCRTYAQRLKSACTKKTISEEAIAETVLCVIQKQIEVFFDFEAVLRNPDYETHRRSQAHSIEKLISQKQRELDETERIKMGLYTDLKKEIITQDDYISLKSGYSEKSAELSQQITALKSELQSLETQDSMQNEWIERFKKHKNIDSLSRQLVTELIEVIYIHESKCITIQFKFRDEFERLFEFAEQEGENLKSAV